MWLLFPSQRSFLYGRPMKGGYWIKPNPLSTATIIRPPLPLPKNLPKKDHHEAQFNLSLMYRDGIGTAKDDSQFWYWLEKSAVVDADAQLLYANAYLQNNPYGKETLEVVRRYLHKFIQHKKHPRQPEGLEQLARIEQLLDIERKNHRPWLLKSLAKNPNSPYNFSHL